MNKAVFVGNVGDDPELRYTPTGAAVANFSVALQKGYKDKDSGQWVDQDPVWINVTAWRGLAENVVESITKGMRVVVVGRMDVDKWEAEDGSKRSRMFVTAEEVAPSLRWATAVVDRRTRGDNEND